MGTPHEILEDRCKAFAAVPALRRFILDRRAQRLPEGVRLYLYVTASPVGRSTGFATTVNEATGVFSLFAEFAWPPLGWVLLFDGDLEDPLREVTWWANYSYDAKFEGKEFGLPCLWTVGGI